MKEIGEKIKIIKHLERSQGNESNESNVTLTRVETREILKEDRHNYKGDNLQEIVMNLLKTYTS